MKNPPVVAVLADVHGNSQALKACLDYAGRRRATHYLFLGDYITDHAYPQRVMEQLYKMERRCNCRFVRGNREDYMVNYQRNGGRQPDGSVWKEGSCQGALLYCYENLTPEDIRWFKSLPVYALWQIGGAPPLACCHGSPESTKGPMRGQPGTWESLEKVEADLLVKGHNHKHFCLGYRGKRIVCAGSVGNPCCRRARPGLSQPSEYAKMAQMVFLHLEGERWKPEYALVPYDWQETVQNLRTSGLARRAPVWAAMLRHNVLTGTDPFGSVPARAVELYRNASGVEEDWANVPEDYWRQAAGEFGIDLEW
ncbi:hypothetical protein D7X94_02450 [Acutalibacter sp. 1XD8-33]|uniref:metallophosphoesterase family protein n=1 Tax=Acutalibacter sp. 1XD8-33 TaxID=2320081 RepID=UPI000EA15766|nr:metallophosphoesterase [Acutalibacter sp. 1XD8-33]RKJ41694.1 hypothetical protein D7X94_02450 [Acutalibacter sp. 1XD8-33]